MKRLTNHTVLITGAGSGIGAALALECAKRGADVVLFDRRVRPLRAVARQAQSSDRKAVAVGRDVRRDSSVTRAVAAARRRLGRIDIVVANAGFEVTGRFDELTLEDYRRQFETNVFGVLRTVYATIEDLKRTHGRLVLVGSMLGHLALPGTSAYAMSKFAIRGFAEALRYELADWRVSVTLITPGNVATNIRRTDNRGVLHPDAADPIPAWLRMTADRAARQIVNAFTARRSECILTRLARVAIATERVAPGVLAEAIKIGRIKGRRARL